jgi:hypothetical protein
LKLAIEAPEALNKELEEASVFFLMAEEEGMNPSDGDTTT